MHDSVPSGDLTELLGSIPTNPPSSTTTTTSTSNLRLPQFPLESGHPYHILVGQSNPSNTHSHTHTHTTHIALIDEDLCH